MLQAIYKLVSLTAISLMLFILWAFQLVWVRSYETAPMVMSGDAMTMTLSNSVPDGDPRWSQAYVNAYWTKKLDASARCPIVRTNPDQIDQVITRIGQLHLTEAEADQAAKRDIAANVARIYLPAVGASEATCAFAREMKAMGMQVTLLNSMPRDAYGHQYVQRYNKKIMELAGLQDEAGA
jgi:hypothetical protein